MSEKNLGSVVGLTLKVFSRHENITNNLDEKGRIIVNTDPIVSGAKYISVKVNTDMQLYNVPVYAINSDSLAGCITLITNKVDGSAGPFLRGILPTPFNYAMKADGITEVFIQENGKILN
nr:MAG TPA: hypothetical protein [Caudoviricetes sp.]